MVPEAPYVGGSRRNKCSHPVNGDDSGDVASLPLAWGSAQHDLPRASVDSSTTSATPIPPPACTVPGACAPGRLSGESSAPPNRLSPIPKTSSAR